MKNKRLNSHYVIWVITLVLSFCSINISAQLIISGKKTVHYGDVVTYTLKDSLNPNRDINAEFYMISWNGDTDVLDNTTETETTVHVCWNISAEPDIWFGVSFLDYSDNYYYIDYPVTVLPDPKIPPAPTILSSNCSEVVLQRAVSPDITFDTYHNPGITWYWQSTADGTSTANSATTITLTSGTQYFLRAKSNDTYLNTGTWSASSSSVTFNSPDISPPIVGTITQATTTNPTGSVVLSGLPSSGSWVINPGNISGTGTTTTITGLNTSATYNFTVTNSTGCTSNLSADVVINELTFVLDTPVLSSVVQPNCSTSTGSFTITNYNASYGYSVTPSTGVIVSGNTFTAPAGTYTVKAVLGGSSSLSSDNIVINPQPVAPAVPIVGLITQPTSTVSTGSVVLSGLPTGSWIINPGGITGSGTSTTITGLAASTIYNFTITNSVGCISNNASANVVIDAQPAACADFSNENYIYSVTPLIATTDVSTLLESQKQESITYVDGLGRPKQTIDIRGGVKIDGTTVDIITPFAYDNFGRQTKEYLSYIDNQNCGLFRTGDVDLAVKNYYISHYSSDINSAIPNPYSEKLFESSPLNRILKQSAPGESWAMNSGHEIKFNYQTNLANEVKNFGVSLSFADNTFIPSLVESSSNNGFYDANELFKTITYDENTTASPVETAGSTVEFTNKLGQLVLKRTYGTVESGTSNEKYDTYYVYDDFGNLTYVLPPKMDATTNLIATINGQLNDLAYQYKYDNKKRLVEKKIPGNSQWEYIVYDNLDRIVATGPVLSPFNDTAANAVGWMITKYDKFDRVVYTGWEQSGIIDNATRVVKQNAQNLVTNLNESSLPRGASLPIDNVMVYYSNTVTPMSFKLLTVNYYDSYTFPGVADDKPLMIEGQAASYSGQYNVPSYYILDWFLAGTWTRVPTSTTEVLAEISTMFYDKKGRLIRLYTDNHFGDHSYLSASGYTCVDTKLDFTGKPEYTVTYHKRLKSDAILKTKEVFTYSPQGKLLKQTHQINDGAIELIASNTYDELGQLISKKVGNNNTSPTQKVDYSYNIRGWLKEINDVSSLSQSGAPKDLFAFKINYNTIPSGIPDLKALYNGNISETQWATNSDNGIVRTYGYKYDNLNRLREGIYKKQNTVTNLYNESMDYDKNGNIRHLKRYGSLDDNSQNFIDDLTYEYKNSNVGNQLAKVTDAIPNNSYYINEFKDSAANGVDDYSYDINGNMTKDNNKNITEIVYNHLNLPTKITFGTAGNIVYNYDATGEKVQKVVNKTGQNAVTTDYLEGYQYSNTALKFFPTAEGYVEPLGSSYKYVYQYKDHLGNVRLSYDKTLAIQEENNYYPFGLKQTGYNTVAISTNDALKYKYNGKELQDDNMGGSLLNVSDYGARNYDPALGRWMNIDPLAEKFTEWSPYTYGINNPITMIDIGGEYAVSVHYRITLNAMIKMGYSKEDARRIAHMASIYADHPSLNILGTDNFFHATDHHYRYDIDYSLTAKSQDESNSRWHSMMSNAEQKNGKTHGQAMRRGLEFGWSNIMAQQKGLNEGLLGQGLHALQDAYAHKGASTNEHLGFNWSSAGMVNNDMYGDTSKAELITQSAVTVLSLFNKDNNGANLKNGMQLDFTGMSKSQLSTVGGLFNEYGFTLQVSFGTGNYTLKQNF